MLRSSPRRILHVVGSLRRGGAETWLVQLLRHIPRSAYQFDFLVHSPEPYPYSNDVEAAGSRIVVCSGYPDALTYSRNFLRILRAHGRYDGVHSHVHHFGGLTLFLAALSGIPVRITHSHLASLYVDRQAPLKRRIYYALARQLLSRYATAGCAVSESAAETLFGKRWHEDGRWTLVPLGIDLTPFAYPIKSAEVRQELGIPSSAYVVGHVGSFEDQKNHKFVIEVASRYASLVPQSHFLLVGDGSLRPSMEAKVKSRGLSPRFTFAGVRDDVPRLMKGAMDVFMLPSKYEGVPMVVFEAQAAGLRCLVSDAVPRDSDVVAGAVVRKSLNATSEEWARDLLSLSTASAPATQEGLFKAYSIEESAASLMRFYERQFRPIGSGR